jgi:hypothetical protein
MTERAYLTGVYGYSYNMGGDWTEVRNSPIGLGYGSSLISCGAGRNGSIFRISRGVMQFDLSGLSGIVTKATFYAYHGLDSVSGNACLQRHVPFSTIDQGLYAANIGEQFGNRQWVNGWNAIELNGYGLSFIQSCLGSNCPLTLRDYSHDFLNASPFYSTYMVAYNPSDFPEYEPYLELEISIVTTPAPTTTLTTPAPTTVITTAAPTTAAPTTPIPRIADIDLSLVGIYTYEVDFGISTLSDPLRDTVFNCNTSHGADPVGRFQAHAGFHNYTHNTFRFDRDPQDLSFDLTIMYGRAISTFNLTGSLDISVRINTSIVGTSVHSTPRLADQSSVWWSRIGAIDFTIDHSNEAGKAFLKGIGSIYGIYKLGKNAVVYGSNGVGILTPVELAWGFKKLSNRGIISRDAHTGNESTSWYIDISNNLCKVSDGIERIGYSEYLSTLTNPVMLIDDLRELIYICDDNKGYVYSYVDDSFSECYNNITGFGYIEGDDLACIPSDVESPMNNRPNVMLKTSVLDFGSRKAKTISSINIATDIDSNIEAAIEYRTSIHDEFKSTPWVSFTPQGIAYLPCYGIEFMIKLRVRNKTTFKLDQLDINGTIHGISKADYAWSR